MRVRQNEEMCPNVCEAETKILHLIGEGFGETTPPSENGSMPMKAQGHRPLTSSFRWGREWSFCEISPTDAIV